MQKRLKEANLELMDAVIAREESEHQGEAEVGDGEVSDEQFRVALGKHGALPHVKAWQVRPVDHIVFRPHRGFGLVFVYRTFGCMQRNKRRSQDEWN